MYITKALNAKIKAVVAQLRPLHCVLCVRCAGRKLREAKLTI